MKVHIFASELWRDIKDSTTVKHEMSSTAERAVEEAAVLLNYDATYVNVTLRPWPYKEDLMKESADGAETHDAEFISYIFDPGFPKGYEKAKVGLREAMFHEMSHAARWGLDIWNNTLLEQAVFEGLAVAFERKYAGSTQPYDKHQSDEIMEAWLQEMRDAGNDWSVRSELFFDHPDGRRWIAYQTGVWIVNRAMRNSGKDVIELNKLPNAEIMALAGLAA